MGVLFTMLTQIKGSNQGPAFTFHETVFTSEAEVL